MESIAEILGDWHQTGWLHSKRFDVDSKVVDEVVVAVLEIVVVAVVVAAADAAVVGDENYGTAKPLREALSDYVGYSELKDHISSYHTPHEERV